MTWEALIEDIQAWQRETFPHATPESVAEHLCREVAELVAAPRDGTEQADVVILAIASALVSGNDLFAEVRNKMAVNKSRTWGAPDADGVVEHVRRGPSALALHIAVLEEQGRQAEADELRVAAMRKRRS